MAEVTCRICKRKIDKEKAYLVEHYTKSGNKTNWWFCSQEEYENDKKEKEFYKECQYLIDTLFGEIVIDNTRNKRLSDLNKAGYTYETIYNCISDNSSTIENALVIKRDDFNCKNGMYLKLAYTFGIIKNELSKYDHKGKDKKLNVDTIKVSDVDKSKRKIKQEKRSLMDIIRGGGNG